EGAEGVATSHRSPAGTRDDRHLRCGIGAGRAGLTDESKESDSMYRGKRISVVIPCHNEEGGIAAVLAQMPSMVDEVVVVDNASTDRTGEVARGAGARVVFEARKGYGRAYKTGFAAARGDVIVTMDGD